jgi:hypothetical protein
LRYGTEKKLSKIGRIQEDHLRTAVLFVLIAPVLIWLGACAAMQKDSSRLSRHPQMEGEDLRNCLECHERGDGTIPYDRFVHTMFFAENHRQPAVQHSDVCNLCHRASFCSDCHGVGGELKPSIKNQSDTDRRMPHRGDYVTRHQIDGRINPAACYRCHGNPKTAASCKPCHG